MKKNRFKVLLCTTAIALSFNLTLSSTPTFAASQSATSLAPIREVAASIGAKVQWNQAQRTVKITHGNHVLILTIGETTATFDGNKITLDEPTRLVSGHALVSTDLITEVFGVTPVVQDPADQFLQELLSGNGDKAAQYVSEPLAKAIPSAVLGQIWNNYELIFGKGQQVGKKEYTTSVHRNVTYSFTAANAPFDLTLRLTLDGQIDDLFIAASSASTYQKPTYDNPATYTEQEITVGQGIYALPGTLTLPVGEGPFPAVVLVHGSGTHDRNSTIGGAKPFRDLAVGLASQGIAVLRYDKITYEHTFKISMQPKFTLKNESVDDALLAVQLLADNPHIESSQIFVAAHSQGGFAMPLMIENDKNHNIAGTILLSAPSSKFTSVLVEQQGELIKRVKQLGLDATPYEQQAAQWTAITSIVDDPKYSVDNIPNQFPLQPAYWWFEQKNYVPSELAKEQSGPLLILQGENDWQVTTKQFEGWKEALKDRKDTEFKSYPKVTHLLSEYDGISIGSEYVQPSNVSKIIIDDIVRWINKTK